MKNKKNLLMMVMGLAMLVAIFLFINYRHQGGDLSNVLAAEIDISPTQYDWTGMDIDTQFVIKTSVDIDPQVILNNIAVEPKIEITGEKKNSQEVLIIPKEPLLTNQVYQFVLELPESDALKWSFQTKGDFKIKGTLPANKAIGVPVNTGIEVNFSHHDLDEVEKYFNISPQVKGRFEMQKKNLIFLPEHLEAGMVYTITIKKGLKIANSDLALAEDYVFQFETQEPIRNEENNEYFEFYKTVMEFPEGTPPYIPVGFHRTGGGKTPSAQVKLFQYNEGQDYINSMEKKEEIPHWAYYGRREFLVPTKNLKEIQNFSLDLQHYHDENYLVFPEALPAGYYLGEVTLGDITRQIWFQVTDLAVYTAVGENKTLAWINDLRTGKPVPEAKVTLFGGAQQGITNGQGLAELTTPSLPESGIYVMVESGEQEAVVQVQPYWSPFFADEKEKRDYSPQDFWKYLYLDREIYKPTDMVYFWGLLKGRGVEIKTKSNIQVNITKGSADGYESQVMLDQEIRLKDHVFSGEVKLPDLLPGHYYLTVKQDDLMIIQQGFEVASYTKPAYQIIATSEKKAAFVGDIVKFKIKVSCFEDTAVPQVPISYHLEDSGELVTDNQGLTFLNYIPSFQKEHSWLMDYRHLYLKTQLAEAGEISSDLPVIVLNNDIDIRATGKITAGSGLVNVQVNKLSVEKVNQGEIDPWEEDAFVAGVEAGTAIKAALYRQEWDKIEDGEHYDFINKVMVKQYRYEERRVFVEEAELVSDRKGQAVYRFAATDNKSYWLQLSAPDAKGNMTQREIFMVGGNYPGDGNYQWYHLENEERAWDKDKYQKGDQVLLTLKNGQGKVADRENGFLFFQGQQGIKTYQIQNNSIFQERFKESDIPNYWVRGIYFDGQGYHEAYEYLVRFDEKEKELQIKVETDKKEYQPRDQVKVELAVTDKKGNPVAATLNLSLVDEALFALRPQEADILSSLYGDYLPDGIWATGYSHGGFNDQLRDVAEQGGGDANPREDFQDTAYFETVDTGKDGRASFTFTLPDNLTSWRLTYQGITKDLKGKSDTFRIPVRLPFFVDLVINDQYLTYDRPTINLRSFGSELDEDEEITFNFRLMQKESKEEIYQETLREKAFKSVPLTLPTLLEGEYEIMLSARGGGYQDTIIRPLKIVKSHRLVEKTHWEQLSTATKLTLDTERPMVLSFTDLGRSKNLSLLTSLMYMEGQRLEQKLAPHIARELMENYFPGDNHLPEANDLDLTAYQMSDGGLGILPYGSSDLALSVKVSPWAGNYFDLLALESYFYGILNDPEETRERSVIALSGLAALGASVLPEITWALQEEDLTVKEKLYLINSYLRLGNEQPVREMLKELIQEYGEENGPYIEINTGTDKDEGIQATCLAAIAASRLKLKETHQLQRYVEENPPKKDLIYLEQINFLEENLKDMPAGEVSFTYTLAEEKTNITLARGENYSIILTPAEAKHLSFQGIEGEIGLTVGYQASPLPKVENPIEGITINREYRVKGGATRQFNMGDLVEVVITWDLTNQAPQGPYRIIDYLPAGLKLVTKPHEWGTVSDSFGWPLESEGQKAVFLAQEKGSLRYYARIINQGSFNAENMTIQHLGSGRIYGQTGIDQVEIN